VYLLSGGSPIGWISYRVDLLSGGSPIRWISYRVDLLSGGSPIGWISYGVDLLSGVSLIGCISYRVDLLSGGSPIGWISATDGFFCNDLNLNKSLIFYFTYGCLQNTSLRKENNTKIFKNETLQNGKPIQKMLNRIFLRLGHLFHCNLDLNKS